MSNTLDPDQGPDLGQNCLPRLSADGTGRQRVKSLSMLAVLLFQGGETSLTSTGLFRENYLESLINNLKK